MMAPILQHRELISIAHSLVHAHKNNDGDDEDYDASMGDDINLDECRVI